MKRRSFRARSATDVKMPRASRLPVHDMDVDVAAMARLKIEEYVCEDNRYFEDPSFATSVCG